MTNTINFREAVTNNRALFDQAYSAGAALQNEAEKAVNGFLDNAVWVNEDVRKNINSLSDVYRQERDRLKAFVDAGFDNLEGLWPTEGRKRTSGKK
jgi:hypothetical protein